jgi:hypothetical protein
MKVHKPHQMVEMFSGSLFEKRRDWQQVKKQLPTHTYFLVTTLDNAAQTRLMLELGRAFRKNGRSVFVLSVG